MANVNAFTGRKIRRQAAASWDADMVVLIEEGLSRPSMTAYDDSANCSGISYSCCGQCRCDPMCPRKLVWQQRRIFVLPLSSLLVHPALIPRQFSQTGPYLNELNAHMTAVVRVDGRLPS